MKSEYFRFAVLLVSALALGGCEGVRLYDKSKADVSAAIKTKYAEADILGTIEVQKKNLDALLVEELKVVRENHQLQVDFSLLELADNDSPMADTWYDEIDVPLEQLGVSSDPRGLRTYIMGIEEGDLRDSQMAGLRRRMKQNGLVDVPPCRLDTKFPELKVLLPEGLDETAIAIIANKYKLYRKACQKKKESIQSLLFGGKVVKAKRAWENAKSDQQTRKQEVENLKIQVDQAIVAHKAAAAAAKAAGKKGEEFEKAIKEQADKLASALKTAATAAPEILSEKRLSSIVTLLKAAAGEQTTVEDDPELATAVVLVRGLSSLSGDIAGLVASAKAPSVSNLLIELQHQTVLLEHAKALQALEDRRIDILKAKFEAYLKEAKLILTFRDALCSFAYHSDTTPATQGHPGIKCDTFKPPKVKPPEVGSTDCEIEGKAIRNCALSKPWKDFLNNPPRDDAGREFYKALAAFTQLFPVRASQIEQDFNLIDLKHRENLAAREMALKAWNNLAAVPIDQLDAYYQSGLKPEAIADLIVKALGFTAITVGVSQ